MRIRDQTIIFYLSCFTGIICSIILLVMVFTGCA